MKKAIFFIVILLASLASFNKCYSSSYRIVSMIPTTTLASKTLYEWAVQVFYSTTNEPAVGVYVSFKFSWLADPKYTLTDENGIAVITDVETPSVSSGKEHTITVTVSDSVLEIPIYIDVGIRPEMEYYSQQFYDPTTKEGLTFHVYSIDTEYEAPLRPEKIDAIAKNRETGQELVGVPEEISIGEYKVIFYTDITGTYDVSIELSRSGYVSITGEATVTLGKPRLVVKAQISDVESWVGYEPSFVDKVTSEMIVQKGQYQIDIYIYNTKGYEVPVYSHEINFILKGMVSGNIYSYHYDKVPGALPLYAEPIGEEPTHHWRILFELTEITYDLSVQIDKGLLYWKFDETLKISTLGPSPDWFSFLYHPWVIIIVFLIIVYVVIKLRKK